MMTNAREIEGTIEAWESGKLGESEKHAVPSKTTSDMVDEALGLQMISIRLDKDLIEVLKAIAKVHGVGYQPLIRDQLHRFANAEAKRLVRQKACALQEEEAPIDDGTQPEARKRA